MSLTSGGPDGGGGHEESADERVIRSGLERDSGLGEYMFTSTVGSLCMTRVSSSNTPPLCLR